jgi:sRNA-binding protein
MTNNTTDQETAMYYHQHQRDEFVRYLAEMFPKCFFEEPDHGRPLKHNIIDDLEARKVLDRDKLLQTLDWYTGHFTYSRILIAGAERVDLDGTKAGVVTMKEQQDARTDLAARKRNKEQYLRDQRQMQAPPLVVTLPAASQGPQGRPP